MNLTNIPLLESEIADKSEQFELLELQIESINKVRPNCPLKLKLIKKKNVMKEDLEKLGRLLQTYKAEVTDKTPQIKKDLKLADANLSDYYTLLDESTTRQLLTML